MNKNISALIVFQGILIIMLLFTACKKDGDLGLNILPQDDEVVFKYDTISVSAYTYKADTTFTINASSTLLGDLNDPFLGKSNASVFFEVNNTLTSFVPEKITEVDSMIFQIPFVNLNSLTDSVTGDITSFSVIDSSYYGDLNNVFNFRAYELNQEIVDSLYYYSNINTTEWHNPIELFNSEIKFTGEENYLKFTMPIEFINKFRDADSTSFETAEDFAALFKGFYLTCDEQLTLGGAIFSLNLNSADAKLSIYYKATNNSGVIDTLSNSFDFASGASHIDIFKHDYTATLFESNMNNTNLQDTVCYIQAMDGLATKVLIDESKFVNLQNKILYDARLLVSLQDTIYAPLAPYSPALAPVLMRFSDDFLTKEPLNEYYTETGYLGVYRDGDVYNFSITKYMQNLLDGEQPNTGLYIKDNAPHISAERTILRTGNNSKPMQIIIKYSDLPSVK